MDPSIIRAAKAGGGLVGEIQRGPARRTCRHRNADADFLPLHRVDGDGQAELSFSVLSFAEL